MNTLDTLKNPTQRWEWIKFQLRARGTSLAAIARSLKVTRNAVNNVKRIPYPRMEREIAKRLDMQPVTLWPDRWDEKGNPRRQRPNRAERNTVTPSSKNTPAGKGSHCQSVGRV